VVVSRKKQKLKKAPLKAKKLVKKPVAENLLSFCYIVIDRVIYLLRELQQQSLSYRHAPNSIRPGTRK